MTTTDDLTYAVRALASALDNVGSRIYSDINPDSSYEPLDERTANLLSDFTAYAEGQLAVLDDPTVKAALAASKES